jgi:hypothetical protein
MDAITLFKKKRKSPLNVVKNSKISSRIAINTITPEFKHRNKRGEFVIPKEVLY